MLTDIGLELHVPDFAKVIAFYSELGFKVLWRTEDYLVMKRRKSILSFYGGSRKIYQHSYFGRFKARTGRGYGVEIILPIEGIDRFYRRVRGRVKVVEPLKLRRWGRRDFRIADPFGFYLRLTERYDWVKGLDIRQMELIEAYRTKLQSHRA